MCVSTHMCLCVFACRVRHACLSVCVYLGVPVHSRTVVGTCTHACKTTCIRPHLPVHVYAPVYSRAHVHPGAFSMWHDLTRPSALRPQEQAGETFWGAAKVKVISHGFQSHEVERLVGAALHDKYNLRADMKNFDVCVRVDVVGEHVLVSSMGNTEMLSKRHKLAFVRSVTLKPNVAFAMLQLASIQPGESLLDPFAGGGTIPLEAAAVLESAAPQNAPQGALFHGCDKSGAVVEGATANARAAGVADRVVFQLSNARGLERTYPGVLFDCIVTNPPWGLRVGKDADLEKIYKGFLYSAARVVKPGGRLVFVVQRCEMVLDIVRRCGLYRIVSLTAIKTGDQVPTIFVLENLVRDALREALKAQVRVLVPLCNSAQKPTAASTAAAAAASAAAPGAAPVDRAEDDRETGSGQTAMGGTDGTG